MIARDRPFRPALRLALACSLGALVFFPGAVHATRRVVVVSFDGLRPDVALRADMPALRALMARGSFTMYAITTDVAITLPSHTSMLTGVPPEQHRITYNSDPRPGQPRWPAWPTLLDIAHRAGLRTALCAGKSKFSVLADSSSLDLRLVPGKGRNTPDSIVADTAAAWMRTRRPDVLFVHLPGLDGAGHASGWGSATQVRAAATVDRAFARITAALASAPSDDSTLIIVSADHGGEGKSHGGTGASSRFIPWIVAGPGVRQNYDLTQLTRLQVHTEDTFATALAWLGLTPEKPVRGRAVSEVFEK
ncbi:MAG: ectonucleotide pyrophosphatase/phosphodiesterase [Candidatus Eisenbacteria bacterium]